MTMALHDTHSTFSSANVAAFIARSPTTSGLPYQALCDINARTFSGLFGGGVRRKFFDTAELEGATGENGEDVSFSHAQYDLVKFLPLHLLRDLGPWNPTAIVCKLPISTVIQKLDVLELRQLAKFHGLPASFRVSRAPLLSMLSSHTCGGLCFDGYAVLEPVTSTVPKHSSSGRAPKYDIESAEFAGSLRPLEIGSIRCYLSDSEAALTDVGFKILRIKKGGSFSLGVNEIQKKDIALNAVLQYLTVPAIKVFADLHGVEMRSTWNRMKCVQVMKDHKCSRCPSLTYLLSPVVKMKRGRKSQTAHWLDTDDAPILWESEVTIPTDVYPPVPASMQDVAKAMKGYCSGLTGAAINEAGCGVCGQLTPASLLHTEIPDSVDLGVLEEVGVTRHERSSSADPIRDIPGPVLDKGARGVCTSCLDSLKKKNRPKMALANDLWLGEVPECLKDLALGEMALISRVRHSRCIVRVAKGHLKMIANVVSFEHPSMKVYASLPMSPADLDQVLSVVYTGVEPPTDNDKKRTPVLVRRERVREALEWLKLNHRDYGDLEIDYARLESYPLEHIPVKVWYSGETEDAGNVPVAARSVFDTESELGTSTGPCPFTVHGLTAEKHGSMSTAQRKVAAIQHLKNGGGSLAVGHDDQPQSIYQNPQLYPQMFPWLFPYGCGGLGQDSHLGKISKENHLRWLLLYHDKRFQLDSSFLIVAFNNQLVKQSSHGSFMTIKRANFLSFSQKLQTLEPGVLRVISDRLRTGGCNAPQSPEEKIAFSLFDQIEYVSGKVQGSISSKKWYRKEVWALTHYLNAPQWFITLLPADSKHPLCIHWAGSNETFSPELKNAKERLQLVTRNPVACAQFFDHVVRLFLKHICGWSDDGPVRGVFGRPLAYYGTVEQQGRMTLHLHILLWIQGQIPLHILREKLLSEDSEFIKALSAYIESCCVGEFLTGSKDTVMASVPRTDDLTERGIHTLLAETDNIPAGYVHPTLTLPEAPPDEWCFDADTCACDECRSLRSWWSRFRQTVDDILVRSNIHKCFARKDNDDDSDQDPSKGSAKKHATAKGCINKQGRCTARFPREVFMKTFVNKKTGHLHIKKQESLINDITPILTYAFRCNTDTNCLLSGTAVKATIGYITGYVTKAWLKTHQVFSTMYDTFSRNSDMLDRGDTQGGARTMLLRIVNSLSAKMEIGAPLAAVYALGNPDRYTSHEFVCFYYKNYVNFVQREWQKLTDRLEDEGQGASAVQDVGVERSSSAVQAEYDDLAHWGTTIRTTKRTWTSTTSLVTQTNNRSPSTKSWLVK